MTVIGSLWQQLHRLTVEIEEQEQEYRKGVGSLMYPTIDKSVFNFSRVGSSGVVVIVKIEDFSFYTPPKSFV